MRVRNFGHEARMKIASWIEKGKLVIDQDRHWIWHGSYIKGAAMMRYSDRLYSVPNFLFRAFYNRFRFEGRIYRMCDCPSCVNPLHRYCRQFVDLNTGVRYYLSKEQAISLFSSEENPVMVLGVYDAKEVEIDDLKKIAPEVGVNVDAVTREVIDLPMLRKNMRFPYTHIEVASSAPMVPKVDVE